MLKSTNLLLVFLLSIFLTDIRPVQSHLQSFDSKIASNFPQVNDSAFGLGSGIDSSFSGEEAKELLVFKDQLYLGMEADNNLGARLWRTKDGVSTPTSQSDWEEVVADSNGYPFGNSVITQTDHIDSLAEFNDYLYVSVGNRGNGGDEPAGTLVYRSQTGNPGSWGESLIPAGFGDINNENFKDMVVFQGWLCGGTWNQTEGAEVWCSQNGINWVQKNISGFGSGINNPNNFIIVHSLVFDNQLYFGVYNSPNQSYDDNGSARLYRTTNITTANPTWQEVYSGTTGSRYVDLLGNLNGYLYIATSSVDGIIILRSPSGDVGSWNQVNIPGMSGNPNNSHTYNDSSVVIDDHLYLAISNTTDGFEIWRTTGNFLNSNNVVDWEQFGPGGWSDSNNVKAGLVIFNNLLYAWTTNYQSGQQVRRANSLILFHTYLPLIEQSVN